MKSPNFSFLSQYDQLLYRSVAQAELYLFTDPNIALIKLRQFGELLAQEVAARSGAILFGGDRQVDILCRIQAQGVLPSKQVQTLEQSILAKAFRGELVPQDPNDGPASVLLERIKTERALQKPKRSKKKTKKKGVA